MTTKSSAPPVLAREATVSSHRAAASRACRVPRRRVILPGGGVLRTRPKRGEGAHTQARFQPMPVPRVTVADARNIEGEGVKLYGQPQPRSAQRVMPNQAKGRGA